jgi:AraC family transcriptional activator of pobA
MVQDLHRHEFFLILALDKGSGTHEIDFTPYPVGNHCIFIMRPGQVHRLTLKAKSSGYLVQFKNDFYFPQNDLLNQALLQATKTNLYQPDSSTFKKLSATLTSIFQEYKKKQEGYQEIIKANLNILFIDLLRQNKKHPSASTDPYAQKRLDQFINLLEMNIAKKKQVAEYANMMNLSLFQLNAITKGMLGKSCSSVINDYIILESKRRLLATTSQVNEIAHSLGFEDVSYFIRFFRKHTGFTPDVFRHNFR